jgi:hypothetical protein
MIMNRASGACVIITKALTLVTLESKKLKRKETGLKELLETIIAGNFPNFAKHPNLQSEEVNPRQN